MSNLRDRLMIAGVLPTKQRLALAELLFSGEDRHITPEELLLEARRAGLRVARATVYNTVRAFCEHGLLREIPVEAGRSYFDTNIAHACHLYFENTGALHDLSPEWAGLEQLLERLGDIDPRRIEIVVYVREGLPDQEQVPDMGTRAQPHRG